MDGAGDRPTALTRDGTRSIELIDVARTAGEMRTEEPFPKGEPSEERARARHGTSRA